MSGGFKIIRNDTTPDLIEVNKAPAVAKPASAWGHRFAIGGGVLLLGIAIIGALGLLHTYGPQIKYPTGGFNHFLEALGDKGQIALTAAGGALGIGLTTFGFIRRRQFIQDESKAKLKNTLLAQFKPLENGEFKSLKEGCYTHEKLNNNTHKVVINEGGQLLEAKYSENNYTMVKAILERIDYKDDPVTLTLPSGETYEMTKTERDQLWSRLEGIDGSKYKLEKGTYKFISLNTLILCDSKGIYARASIESKECGKFIAYLEHMGYKPAKAKDETIAKAAETASQKLKESGADSETISSQKRKPFWHEEKTGTWQ